MGIKRKDKLKTKWNVLGKQKSGLQRWMKKCRRGRSMHTRMLLGFVYLTRAQKPIWICQQRCLSGFLRVKRDGEKVSALPDSRYLVRMDSWTGKETGFIFLLQCLPPHAPRFTAAPLALCSEERLQASLLASRDPKYVRRYPRISLCLHSLERRLLGKLGSCFAACLFFFFAMVSGVVKGVPSELVQRLKRKGWARA